MYTLNVDDLPAAVARRHALKRRIVTLSAVNWGMRALPARAADALEAVHLNGVLNDAPDGVTFSPTQYAERLAGQEPLYDQCAIDVLTRPVVFIGTPLDEAPLWQHVAMRKRGPRTRREFRRESFIVTPKLDRARSELLQREFNVTHIPMGVEDFSKELLAAVSGVVDEGFAVIGSANETTSETTEPPLAQDLSATSPTGSADYLLGRAPTWGDVRDGFSASRKCDAELEELVKAQLRITDQPRGAILVAGTAGSGKSTVVMRLALAVTAAGAKVAWVDSTVDISPLNLRRWMDSSDAPVLIVDDVDRYGNAAPVLVTEIAKSSHRPLIIGTIRSGRGADRFADRYSQVGGSLRVFDMPDLADEDILLLIGLLESNKRLGVLKGLDRASQIRAFKDAARRQILVAMLEATSGRRFEDLIESEMRELSDDTHDLYALTAVASALRFGLTRDELLLAIDDRSNDTLAAIDALQRRRLIIADSAGTIRVRHRVIGEVLMRALARDGQLADAITGLAVAAASKVTPGTRRGHPAYRRLRALMSHDWLTQYIGVASARQVYEALEAFMQWDYHYWLQRGSFELEHGEFQHAENFLNQAYSLNPDDPLVKTEYAYLTLRRAVIAHIPGEARESLQEGFALLKEAIADREGSDPHQYHIYGKEGLNWLMRGDVTPKERTELLEELQAVVLEGVREHPSDERLRQLLVEVQNAQLGYVASASGLHTPAEGTPIVRSVERPRSKKPH
jgi:RecA/RadA recombinase